MTREEAIKICEKFCEDNKYKSDWNGYLSGAIDIVLNEIPFNYKELVKESEEKCPNEMWEANAYRRGALDTITKIYSNKSKEDIIKDMTIPTITLDDKFNNEH